MSREFIKFDDFINDLKQASKEIAEYVENPPNHYDSIALRDGHHMYHVMYEAFCNKSVKLEACFPYEFVESYEERSTDSDGYYYIFIFQRKSDNKFFSYSTYEGCVEEDRLYQTEKVTETKTKWS